MQDAVGKSPCSSTAVLLTNELDALRLRSTAFSGSPENQQNMETSTVAQSVSDAL